MDAGLLKNNRGIALIIVLLVTALLLALVFEFAYGTRVSFRAATNFRDSQRAYFLARAGINYFKKNLQLREYVPRGEWSVLPIISGGDTEVKVTWEDEGGKITLADLQGNRVRQAIIRNLFQNKGIDRTVADRIIESPNLSRISLLTELHEFMSDADYNKVSMFLTASLINSININTASKDVLLSLGISPHAVELLVEDRKKNIFSDQPSVTNYYGIKGVTLEGVEIATYLTYTSSVSKLFSHATVGDYTKQIETVVGGNIPYWKSL